MSVRGVKRASGVRGEEPGASKRRRTEPEDALWQLRQSVSDLKMSSIYNRSASEAPAELFRKDLISAMKLPDSEPLTTSEYWVITDTWKQDWERGVQVPVNPDSLPAPKVKIIENPLPPDFQEHKLPKDKYVHLNRDAIYQPDKHLLSTTPAKAEAACSYDLDATDTAWMKLLNAERARAGAGPVTEHQLEKVIEELEVRTWDKIQAIMKSEEGLGIEYDENVICDVCRSPDSEDGNEMVFCDACNICVHQACYGITVIPDGQWLCRPCGDGVRPTCVLCPNLGGAMKCTPSGHKWAHVSCVLWIPEVSIGCAEKMEPITKISAIPASRWSLVCVLCRERKGSCIQCSVKTCKTAYHVTCAFKHGLEMRAIIEDENADDGVKLRSYCQKHSVNSKKEKCPGSDSEAEEVKRKRRKDMTSEEKNQARAARLQEIEREFDRHVSVKDISTHLLDVDQDAINYIYNYWKLKRRAGHNRPLLPPKSDDNELLTHRQEQADIDKMKMFVQLRQDLERVRNLCYMVSRREKLSRSFFRMREQTFHKQVAVLSSDSPITGPDLAAIIEANHGPSIYDKLYSHPDAPDHKHDFEELLARIAPSDSGDEKKKDRNGLIRGAKSSNPYKKHYVNGSRRSESMYSGLSSEESATEAGRSTRFRGRAIGSSTEEDVKKPSSPKKKISPKGKGKRSPKKIERKKKKVPQSKALVESSSEEDNIKPRVKKDKSRSKTLQQMEKEMAEGRMGQSGTDSDELMPMRSTRNSKFPVDIYSDSSEEVQTKKETKTEKVKPSKYKSGTFNPDASPSENESQQPLPRTKAAMKEFIPTQPEKKSPIKEEKSAPKKRGRKPSEKKMPVKSAESDDEAINKENIKFSKQKDNPTDLIVPQRQAAKKASENMRSTTTVKKDDSTSDKQTSGDDTRSKPKIKSKGKEIKESSAPTTPVKVGRKKSKDVEKETIAYVPQRQAAKKAAAHIKSGLGTKAPVAENQENEKKKEIEKGEAAKLSPKKEEVKESKSSEKDSSSSSSNSSSSSYSSSSSSEEEQEKPDIKPTAKAREIKPATRQPSLFSPPASGSRPILDLPFLDKVSRPLSSTSASSDSDSSKGSRYSGSSSPSPKRPRRRRKGKSLSTDTSPRKAPDKKLKTSERGSECGVSSPPVEGEEPGRADGRAATRARTRSTTASGNMPHKPPSGPRKPSQDDAGLGAGSKPPKESPQPGRLSTPERKEGAEVKEIKRSLFSPEHNKAPARSTSGKSKMRSASVDDKEKVKTSDNDSTPARPSPRKSVDVKEKRIGNRRQSVMEPQHKETLPHIEDKPAPAARERRTSRHESISTRTSQSPNKKRSSSDKMHTSRADKKSPIRINDDYSDNDKHWVRKVSSPNAQPPPVEKLGSHEKYMTEDKSLDSDSADKSSIKLIAKIQANLNENTMIKSPKTPMDARTITLDPMDMENPMSRNIRQRSTLESEKKYITQDASHLQGVEISKSAKIPSTGHTYPSRLYSPQQKDNDLFELDMLNVDDGFNNDIIKPITDLLFKEDTKEEGVQETLNLVGRLRMQLSCKKMPPETSAHDDNVYNDDKEHRDEENNVTPVNAKGDSETHYKMTSQQMHENRVPAKDSMSTVTNLDSHSLPTTDHLPASKHHHAVPMTSHDRWQEMPTAHNDVHTERPTDRKFDHTATYNEEIKEPPTVQSDLQSVSGDTISLSKQSDDSQSLSVVDNSVHSNDQELTQDNQTYDNNNSLIHSDCATISSPYVSQESKWRESKIATRRSSASSTDSEGSVCSRKTDVHMKPHINSCDSRQANVMPGINSYPPSLPYSCPIEQSMPISQYTYPTEASPFLTTMASLPLFPPVSSHMPMSSVGAGLYQTGLSFARAPLIQTVPKPAYATLSAAFTSSSQNIALTTAMIAPPTPKPESPRDDIDVTGSDKFIHVVSSPSVSMDSYNEASNPRPSNKMSNDSNETIISIQSQESKSPPKPPKPMTKFPGKSPGKSPGISPKQSEAPKAKRLSNKSQRGNRGRGRSKSRMQGYVDYMGNSIQSNLVGTVYDFDEEIANDGVDLKALRERRKSIDVRDDRKSDYKDSSQSPHLASPPSKRLPPVEVKETPKSSPPPDPVESPSKAGFSAVAPVLPGPVDMRTYQGFEAGSSTGPSTGGADHLLAFAAGTADQQLAEIDEEIEKQLHSALAASKSPPRALPPPEPHTPHLPKVSLSDPRNQLKVKIKGPFLDANYSTSSTPVVPQPPPPVHDVSPNVIGMAASSSMMMTGSTNLRRMRKKELLRQYWTQDMNMDDPANTSIAIPPPAQPPPLARAVITIPKAVASMTCIPTREDYRTCETPIEKKKRKTTSGVSRELRHLVVSMNDDVEPTEESKVASYNSSQALKRRGRGPGKVNSMPVAPKLKIKLGTHTVHVSDDSPSAVAGCRPPKKRIIVHKPTLEDLRRESMKYRRMVMADFAENEKTTKHKPTKSEKRKKKKDKKAEKLQVINSESESATKLIIKIKRTKEEEEKARGIGAGAGEPPVDPFEYDPEAPDPLAIDPPSYSGCTSAMRKIRTAKVTPIRLKLSRSSQGSGYVMKESEAGASAAAGPSPALPVSKHCEVR